MNGLEPYFNIVVIGSPLIEAAWSGRLLHLSGLDVIGSTAGSLSRMLQDREIELWEGKRIVGSATRPEVGSQFVLIFNSFC
jgi:hypothetical protein